MSISVGTFHSLELFYRLSWKSFSFAHNPNGFNFEDNTFAFGGPNEQFGIQYNVIGV